MRKWVEKVLIILFGVGIITMVFIWTILILFKLIRQVVQYINPYNRCMSLVIVRFNFRRLILTWWHMLVGNFGRWFQCLIDLCAMI